MKNCAKRYLLTIIGVFTGALAGYLYWKFIGCNSGTCTITADPVNSTIYGSVMGGLLGSIFRDSPKKEELNKENNK